MVEFIEEGHIYKLDGQVIPSVTQILDAAGLGGFKNNYTEQTAERGTNIHKTVELFCQAKLTRENLTPAAIPYINAWVKFCKDYNFTSQRQETRDASPNLKVGFTIDHFGFLATPDNTAIVDIKTGVQKIADVIQICAYGLMNPAKRLLILYLSSERYKVVEVKGYDRQRGERTFLSALSLYQFRKKEKLL